MKDKGPDGKRNPRTEKMNTKSVKATIRYGGGERTFKELYPKPKS